MASSIDNEPRALAAALDPQRPVFTTRGSGLAMHAANRHVERWAPEASANRVRSLRSLGFVDRLIAPWIETAQRSASLRLFNQYSQAGMAEGNGRAVSWVFPRPWYQDELDWMAAARQMPQGVTQPAMFTTRGTYVVPETRQRVATALPAALYEYIAPSLSVAAREPAPIAGVGFGGGDVVGPAVTRNEAYSPLVSLAAVQAAELMSRTVQRLPNMTASVNNPALRNVLSAMLTRAAIPDPAAAVVPSRLATRAPELVTPPAPSLPRETESEAPTTRAPSAHEHQQAMSVATHYAEQRTRVVEVQRIAQQAAEREFTARGEAAAAARTEQAVAARAEVDVRQRAVTAARTEEQRRQVEDQHAATTERIRTHRLHDQARADAAAHARAAVAQPPEAPIADQQAPAAPTEVAAAIAALPHELASFLARQPQRAIQVIAELNETYRTVELMARSAATGRAFEVTRGPRLMMPVGLGGLVAAVDQVYSLGGASQPALAGQAAVQPTGEAIERPLALASRSIVRAPALPWLSAAAPRMLATPSLAPRSALGAAAARQPAALAHVAWSDRWLARFAGASQQSLDTLSVGAGIESSRGMSALAAAAPGTVFVSPFYDVQRDGESVRFDTAGRTIVTPSAAAIAPLAIPADVRPAATQPVTPTGIVRYDDAAETPDDVFAAISEAAARGRGRTAPPTPVVAEPPVAARPPIEHITAADAIAHSAPASPSAGLSAQLAASPFAPALRHILPLPAASRFDVRSLFGGAVSATYLAGLLGDSSYEVDVAAAQTLPVWARWSESADAQPSDSAAPSWEPTYVAPDVPELARDADDVTPTAPQVLAPQMLAPLTTLRTALLSWDAETVGGETPAGALARPISTARTMVEAMSLPMIGGDDIKLADTGESWTAPGMLASRAHGWSVAQERSSSDLAFDFVTPELVLAARVYGLGPAEAAQAARLAIAGPGQLGAMANTVDRTFVQAMAIEAQRRERGTAIATAYPMSTGDLAAVVGPAARRADVGELVAPMETPPRTDSLAGVSFGVERRAPRGAFLWPSGTIAALNLSAAAPDGQQSMTVAALELLAAQAVAELGTYAALEPHTPDSRGVLEEPTESSDRSTSPAATRSLIGAPREGTRAEPSEGDVLGAASALVPAERRGRFDALYVALSQSPAGRTWSPAARAARALALAGRGEDAGISARERAMVAWDVLPVVYAMEASGDSDAMPMVSGRSGVDDRISTGMTPREATRGTARRGAPGLTLADAGSGGDSTEPSFSVEARPGLGALSARAGEALGSYVSPAVAPSAPSASASASTAPREREVGAVLRAPTAAQEMVQTGRSSGRFGGGETEIPAWFEAAARKMFDSQSGTPMGDGISMSELTLISAAPSTQIAASTKTPPAAGPIAPALGSAGEAKPGQKVDIEKIANEIYRQILVMMDAARARNGEPYL